MGDAADDILEGRVCQVCGEWLIIPGEEYLEADSGYPITCDACK